MKLETYYGLPENVEFCKRCVISNQRPASAVEFKHKIDSKKTTMHLDENGICDACKMADIKDSIDCLFDKKLLKEVINNLEI